LTSICFASDSARSRPSNFVSKSARLSDSRSVIRASAPMRAKAFFIRCAISPMIHSRSSA